jgi:cyclopropane fatty-acyl-phospholipid synthase-like methyltransferase
MKVTTWHDPHTLEDYYDVRVWEVDDYSELKTEVFDNKEYVSVDELRKHMTHYTARQSVPREFRDAYKPGFEVEVFDDVLKQMCVAVGHEIREKWLRSYPTLYQEIRWKNRWKIARQMRGKSL